MITPDIDAMKDSATDGIQMAIESFFIEKINQLKAEVHRCQGIFEEAKFRKEKAEEKYRSITSKELREKFFERDIMKDISPYEAFLKGK